MSPELQFGDLFDAFGVLFLTPGSCASAGGLRAALPSQFSAACLLPRVSAGGDQHLQEPRERVRHSQQWIRALCCCSEPQMCWTACTQTHLALQLHPHTSLPQP